MIVGVTLWCYIMPTKHERIGVVKDEALQQALESVASIVGVTTPAATVVHDLAIRGARAIQDDATSRTGLLRDLAEWSTGTLRRGTPTCWLGLTSSRPGDVSRRFASGRQVGVGARGGSARARGVDGGAGDGEDRHLPAGQI